MEKRTAWKVFILTLMFGMVMKQFTAEAKMTMNECYRSCIRTCMMSSLGNYRAKLGCVNCYAYCHSSVYGETCFLKWCWKNKTNKWCIWSFGVGDNYEYLMETMPVWARTSEYQKRIKSYDITWIKLDEFLD